MQLRIYSLYQNTVEDFSQNTHPAVLKTWKDHVIELPDTGTHLGFVYQGCSDLSRPTGTYRLQARMYFCLPGRGMIGGENSSGMVVTYPDYRGLFSLGGPIESQGRFAYIDGGTSSLLIPPVMLGDPCLHAMYFPAHVDQTLHTHASYRIGIVVVGRGELKTPQTAASVEAGTIFLIPANHSHKFCTGEDSLISIVFHPDSDTGFTHQNHPMLQRTIVNGISAVELPQIQTKFPLGSQVDRLNDA